jgi:uncharacterized protein (UPF0335 family)
VKLKEGPEDIAVKARLWRATVAEAERFAQRFERERVAGERYSDGQRDVIHAAKMRGYPAFLVRAIAAVQRGSSEKERADRALGRFRAKIGL